MLHWLMIASVAGFGAIQQHVPRTPHERVSLSTRTSSTSLSLSNNDDDDDNDNDNDNKLSDFAVNVLGTRLVQQRYCSSITSRSSNTGFPGEGNPTVCVKVDDDFLGFSEFVGNDLTTPRPEHGFPGLKEGDLWCLRAEEWYQAYQYGKAPDLYLKSTHAKALDHVSLDLLRSFALDREEADDARKALDEQREGLSKLFARHEMSVLEERQQAFEALDAKRIDLEKLFGKSNESSREQEESFRSLE